MKHGKFEKSFDKRFAFDYARIAIMVFALLLAFLGRSNKEMQVIVISCGLILDGVLRDMEFITGHREEVNL